MPKHRNLQVYVIERGELEAAYTKWEKDRRGGSCLTYKELASKSPKAVGKRMARALISYLYPEN